jgi:Uma2 family endonuclease
MTFAKDLVLAAPDLVVDVVDSASRGHVRLMKLPEYAREGVREAWVVDPEAETTGVFSGEEGVWVREHSVLFGDPIPSEVVDVGTGGLAAL